MINVNVVDSSYDFEIIGSSYAGCPRDNTMMYIGKKVEYLVENIKGHKNCLVFVENGIEVEPELTKDNCFYFCKNAQFEYAKFASTLDVIRRESEKNKKFTLVDGYYIGENVTIGENAFIEPGVVIGHDVVIGKNATILANSVIKHAIIGDNFLCNENSVIGNYSHAMARNEENDLIRIPAFGRVIIKDDVEIGAECDVACGCCGDTILENHVKLDSLVHVGHEDHLYSNVQVTAGGIIAGFVDMAENTYLGVNASIRNRISLGNNCLIGMGAVVTKSVPDNITVAGNPAREFKK